MNHPAELRAVLSRRGVWVAALAVVGIGAALTGPQWWPGVAWWLRQRADMGTADLHPADEHAGHDHAAGVLDSIELSPAARKSIRLEVGKVTLGPYQRTISVPGIIVEQPGRTTSHVTAPLTGVVSQMLATRGEAVRPGQRLFELRLTDEDVVQSQANLLHTIEEIDVIDREIARLDDVTREGGVKRKDLLDRQYEKQKKQATLRAQRQALLLHGLSEEQIAQIEQSHKLLRTFSIFAPEAVPTTPPTVFHLQQIKVELGQSIEVGATLAVLTNLAELLVEGDAYERDVQAISAAAREGRKLAVRADRGAAESEVVRELPILYVDSQVDPASRTFHFYARLPNTIISDVQPPGGARYIDWRFKPGQRLQVQVPVETWPDRIVLPVDAVAQDGVENFVFQENGKKFDRRPVHVEYRDETRVVIANDGAVFPGDTLAMTNAQQLLIAIKNKAGGAPDPHAGHNH